MLSNKCSWLCFSPDAVLPNTSVLNKWSRHHLKSKDVFRETKHKILSWESREEKVALWLQSHNSFLPGEHLQIVLLFTFSYFLILDLDWCWFFCSSYNYKGISNIKPLMKLYTWSFKFAVIKHTLKFFSLYFPLSIWTKLLTHWPNGFEAL